MPKALLLIASSLVALSCPAFAQEAAAPDPGSDDAFAVINQGEIVVTATRRASPLSDVPIAVSAITADALRNTGATDTRQLNQISPSLFVSSSSSEAAGGGARIRGIGTVGDNPGLESSVTTFIDGVYRNRSGVGLTELGPVERIEVLRGPQGTLFGRNASAGLINVVTARPKFQDDGYAEASYGNYDYRRFGGGVTGPVGGDFAYRVDGVYTKRDGFMHDVISGRDINNRDRYLVRGKLLYEPGDDLSVMLIADYAKRNEECCVGSYLPPRDVTRNPDGTLAYGPSSMVTLMQGIVSNVPGAGAGLVLGDTYNREVALTPGRDFRSDVHDWGLSGEVNWSLGGVSLTSITAYRDWKYTKGQDADFSNLDIMTRPSDGSGFTRFRTFSQELRLRGSAFDDRLDWLVGGYFAHEKLALDDNLSYGADYDQFVSARAGAASPALAAFPLFGFRNLNGFAAAFATAQGGSPAVVDAVAGQVLNTPLDANTVVRDHFRQTDRNFALFTHNIVKLSDTLSLTLGARYTDDRKTLAADLNSNSSCGVYLDNISRLRALAAAPGTDPMAAALAAGLANQVLAPLAGFPCVVNAVNGTASTRKKEGEWSGTAVLSFKPTDRLLTYVSYSRGYKAGGFNLDRSPLFDSRTLGSTLDLDVLKFEPEKVDSYEVGAKFKGRQFNINVAAFYEIFKSFQLNTFNGVNFFVTDIKGCKDDLGDTDQDLIVGNSSCANTRSGVTSKGFEIEASLYPTRDFTVAAGFVYADSKYRDDLVGTTDFFVPANGNSLQPTLFGLPGGRLSNSAKYVVTGSANWTPPIGDRLRGLVYADFRYMSALNSGSDLFAEKEQPGVMLVNARLGLGEARGNWSLEFWAQNLFN
ncbi:MAG TPA: TonB-dependent receptor, partial [Sphingomonadaceae bacterium]|nr:TonB-dependent receptor [Sphingomonadaceae bacterium]